MEPDLDDKARSHQCQSCKKGLCHNGTNQSQQNMRDRSSFTEICHCVHARWTLWQEYNDGEGEGSKPKQQQHENTWFYKSAEVQDDLFQVCVAHLLRPKNHMASPIIGYGHNTYPQHEHVHLWVP